jgi:RND family efflux transporter MFP subunit
MFTKCTHVKNRIPVRGAALIVLPALVAAGCSTPSGKDASTRSVRQPVETVAAQAVRGTRSTILTATLSAEKESVISAEVSEKIIAWPVTLGQNLHAGDLIAQLDARSIAAQVEQAQGQVAQARAEVSRLTAEYQRTAQETAAQMESAQAGVEEAEANRVKTDTITRTQELRQAEARLVQAKTDEDLARKEFERYRDLVAGGAASRQTLDQIQTKFDVATQQAVLAEQAVSLAKEGARNEDRAIARSQLGQARAAYASAKTRPSKLAAIRSAISAARGQLASAEAALHLAQVQLSKHRITAPFSGRVLSVKGELGELAVPGSNLVVLGSTAKLKLLFSVPEQYRANFHPQKLAFTVDSLGGKTFYATLRAQGYSGDQRTRNYAFEGSVDNSREELFPGMVAKVKLDLGDLPKGVQIPIDCLVLDGNEASVYVVADGRVQRRRVLIGERLADQAQIPDGIKAGDYVVRSPKNLIDGAQVKEVTK